MPYRIHHSLPSAVAIPVLYPAFFARINKLLLLAHCLISSSRILHVCSIIFLPVPTIASIALPLKLKPKNIQSKIFKKSRSISHNNQMRKKLTSRSGHLQKTRPLLGPCLLTRYSITIFCLHLPQIMRGSSGLSRFATEREAEDPVTVVIYFLYLFLQTSVNFTFSKIIYLNKTKIIYLSN